MSLRGQKPKPAALKARDGDTRKIGAHKLAEQIAAEPRAEKGLPACPRHLRYRAREAWKFWVAALQNMDLDRRPDQQMLEGACFNYARAIQAEVILLKEGVTVKEYALNKEGDPVLIKIRKHPAVDIAHAAWRSMKAFCTEFGLSPVSRARLTIDNGAEKQGEDDLMRILSQTRERKKRPDNPQETVQ